MLAPADREAVARGRARCHNTGPAPAPARIPLVSQKVLLESLESSWFMVPEVPGKVAWLRIPGVRGWITHIPYYRANKVNLTASEPAAADRAIAQVVARFASQGKGVNWVVGPSNGVPDLERRLLAAGFTPDRHFLGMALYDLRLAAPAGARVTIREVDGTEMAQHIDLVAAAFGMTRERAELAMFRHLPGLEGVRTRAYLAYSDGRPVAFGTLQYAPRQPVVVLHLAGVLEGYRRQGIYTSLVARRLADAAADGVTAALVVANPDTAAPICAGLGFREIGRLTTYAWQPT